MQTYVHGEADQVHHSGRDSMGRSLMAGGRYQLGQPGKASKTVVIVEDESTGDLYLKIEGDCESARLQRVDECAVDCSFSLVIDDGQVDDLLLVRIQELLTEAAGSRLHLAAIETKLSQQLGCDPGDGSDTWNAISSAVRDGLGTPFDLAQLKS